jgi:flagellar assembly factor FliW
MLAENTVRKPASVVKSAPPAEAPAKPDIRIIESRFGTIEIGADAMINLPNGLLGFSDFHEFGLAALPDGRHPQFRVLQCLTASDLAFLVVPLNMEGCAIDAADIAEACATLGISRERLAVLLIVTVRRDENGAHVSLNMRAPLFVDTARMIGRQYVMPNNKYSIRHAL